MRKLMLSLLLACAFCLAACSYQDISIDNNENVDNKEERQIDKNEIEKEETNISKDFTEPQRVSLNTISEIVKNVEVGTAGSSLKVVKPTSNLMDWSLGAEISQEQLKEIMDYKLCTLSDDEKEMFLSQMSLIKATYKALMGENRDALLEESGNADLTPAWLDVIKGDNSIKTLEVMEALFSALNI